MHRFFAFYIGDCVKHVFAIKTTEGIVEVQFDNYVTWREKINNKICNK